MEMVTDYLFKRYVPQRDPLPFPQYLMPQHKWENAFWITKEGECVHPWEMNDHHLLHTVRLIHRTTSRLRVKYDDCGAHRYIEHGFYVYYQVQKKKDEINMHNKKSKKKMGYSIPRDISLYCDLWTDYYLYMLLRREIKLRGLEEHL